MMPPTRLLSVDDLCRENHGFHHRSNTLRYYQGGSEVEGSIRIEDIGCGFVRGMRESKRMMKTSKMN